MFVVMGANGHVGSAVAKTLLSREQQVIVVTHDETHGHRWHEMGAKVAVADVGDAESLRSAFARGRRAFLLNPPADVKTDTDLVERAGVAGILAALDGSGLEKLLQNRQPERSQASASGIPRFCGNGRRACAGSRLRPQSTAHPST